MSLPPPSQVEQVDPAIKAARITRTGAVIAAVVAALITGTATGLGAYFAGRKEGVSAATPSTVTSIVTVSAPAGRGTAGTSASSSGSSVSTRPGETSVLDLEPIETGGVQAIESQKINTEQHDRVIAHRLGDCKVYPLTENSAFRTYQVDRRFTRLQARVGLGDTSASGAVAEFWVSVDGRRVGSSTVHVGVGEVKSIDVDVSGAFRVAISVVRTIPAGVSSCLGAPFVTAAWIEPVLR
ncbi:NPCBM/NEW2 domain-containing protein [Actinokineospora sp. HUAS TT18]|uniref:NPCBM/NEW2 domain-containing protein n=1 Tax=Actinokineospora sp. HUAS TT18 TaxID=3447451 RepID=UPI003F51BF23